MHEAKPTWLWIMYAIISIFTETTCEAKISNKKVVGIMSKAFDIKKNHDLC